MPNWVHAGFNVTGDQSELARFQSMMFRPISDGEKEALGGFSFCDFVLDFNGILPMPAEAQNAYSEGWAVDNWGTKWNASDVSMKANVEEGKIRFQFSTPWDFPEPVFEALAAAFPTLVFRGSAYCVEDDMEWVGEFNGEDNWGPGEIQWINCDPDEEEDAADVD